MKLQKLVYYCQVWSIVWDDNVIFDEPIEARENGPVVGSLWEATRGQFRVAAIPEGKSSNLSAAERATVDKVLSFYGPKDAQWLSDLTHMEAPWREAYDASRNTTISLERISEFYSSIAPHEQAASET